MKMKGMDFAVGYGLKYLRETAPVELMVINR